MCEVGFAIKATPYWWVIGVVLTHWRWPFLAWQASHYIGVLWAAFYYSDILEMGRIFDNVLVMLWFAGFVGLFVLAQTLLWHEWMRAGRKAASGNRGGFWGTCNPDGERNRESNEEAHDYPLDR